MEMDTQLARMLLLLLQLLSTFSKVPGLYFPQSDVSLRFPYLDQNGGTLGPDIVLYTARAIFDNSSELKNPKYVMESPREEFASFDPKSGKLTLNELPKNGAMATFIVRAKGRNEDAILELKVEPIPVKTKEINCSAYVKDKCFWKTSKYRVYENKPITRLGSIGPDAYNTICPHFQVTRYELLNGTDYFHVIDNNIFSNASLDRDTLTKATSEKDAPSLRLGPGPHVDVMVLCVIWDEKTGNQHPLKGILSIDIIDENDNAPIPQMNSTLQITLQDFKMGQRLDVQDLIVNDADTMLSNKYSVRILNDTHNSLNLTSDTMPIDHPMRPPYTAIYARIHAKTTLLPESPYIVILQITDETLLPGYGERTVNTTLIFEGPQHITRPSTTEIPLKQDIFFPKIAKLSRLAPKYYRVAQPSIRPNSKMIFNLQGTDALNITREGGIIFVENSTQLNLLPNTIEVKIEWQYNGNISSTSLTVNVIDGQRLNKEKCHPDLSETHSCANAKTRQKCEISCGVASGTLHNDNFVGQCVWRANNARSSSTAYTEQYETCSPTLSYCPDHNCDDLEHLDTRICPQDCTIQSEAHFADVNKNGRGIRKGLNICWCNDLTQCFCGLTPDPVGHGNNGGGNKNGDASKTKKIREEKKGAVPGARKVAFSSPCGPVCLIGVIGASLFVLVAIAGIFVMRRYRMVAKGSRRECKHGVDNGTGGLGILPSDYVDRGDGLLIGLDSLTNANHTLLLPKSCPPDPKWEFARSRLTIEQVLGEGEFGRVLRARAIDIGGWPGPTTVAVKTLKEGACTSELADLLSEYQLLKEAQHPNVIRLLGACTSPGGPIYLIIEFAEFGSLRNYLRRSRHLESEGRAPCSTFLLSASPGVTREGVNSTEAASNYGVTPRDILSFAWQISKGMAYLADIKLVHRDLAARNVLLATGKVCKISDFGLTRDVYEDDAYLKRSKGRVPVKWMAPESLADHVYTSKSDVWSFGVLLWELVTLGASPYPGVDVHNLYNLLKAGYRMEKPANCSHQLYKLMVSCWHEEPGMRPSFKELTCHWERMLEAGVEYLDLNPRTVHNRAYFTSLHALDSPTNSGSELGYGNINIFRTDAVNYLRKPSAEEVTKCDKVDKLQALWQQPIASFPEEPLKPPYVNDSSHPVKPSANHYESPIKTRNSSVTSNVDNTSKTPPNERPLSYIDMEGKKDGDLLLFSSIEKKIDNGVVNGVTM